MVSNSRGSSFSASEPVSIPPKQRTSKRKPRAFRIKKATIAKSALLNNINSSTFCLVGNPEPPELGGEKTHMVSGGKQNLTKQSTGINKTGKSFRISKKCAHETDLEQLGESFNNDQNNYNAMAPANSCMNRCFELDVSANGDKRRLDYEKKNEEKVTDSGILGSRGTLLKTANRLPCGEHFFQQDFLNRQCGDYSYCDPIQDESRILAPEDNNTKRQIAPLLTNESLQRLDIYSEAGADWKKRGFTQDSLQQLNVNNGIGVPGVNIVDHSQKYGYRRHYDWANKPSESASEYRCQNPSAFVQTAHEIPHLYRHNFTLNSEAVQNYRVYKPHTESNEAGTLGHKIENLLHSHLDYEASQDLYVVKRESNHLAPISSIAGMLESNRNPCFSLPETRVATPCILPPLKQLDLVPASTIMPELCTDPYCQEPVKFLPYYNPDAVGGYGSNQYEGPPQQFHVCKCNICLERSWAVKKMGFPGQGEKPICVEDFGFKGNLTKGPPLTDTEATSILMNFSRDERF